jgi:cytochrome c peroxidase
MDMKKNMACVLCIVGIFIAGPVFAETLMESLGCAIYNDLNLSINQNQACMSCHHRSSGFADPQNRIAPELFPVSNGSDLKLFGGRNAPSASYAGFSPIFHYDTNLGLFVGGLFWDGRATGMIAGPTATGGMGSGPTGDPLADQAKGPFGNPVEMALPLVENSPEAAVVAIIEASRYADKFKKVFGPDAFSDVAVAYNNASLAIAAFERSNNVNKFNSKFDKFVKEQGGSVANFGVDDKTVPGFRKYVGPPAGFRSRYYSYDEADGLAIFNADSYTQKNPTVLSSSNGGQCYLCHLTTNHAVDASDPNQPQNGPAPGTYNPILTDFTFDNLGIPVNPQIAILLNNIPQPTDLGLGGQQGQLEFAYSAAIPDDPVAYPVKDEYGKFKVPSLRNLSRTAPYGHNGYFATINDIVNFYNTRNTPGLWPKPEFPDTVNNSELGNLGLTLAQEKKLVKFLKTLND